MKSKTWVITLSMTKIAKAKTKEPTITKWCFSVDSSKKAKLHAAQTQHMIL
jgi:hypothetical protein